MLDSWSMLITEQLKDYEDLIADVIAKVKENSGVTLEPEVRIIGDK